MLHKILTFIILILCSTSSSAFANLMDTPQWGATASKSAYYDSRGIVYTQPVVSTTVTPREATLVHGYRFNPPLENDGVKDIAYLSFELKCIERQTDRHYLTHYVNYDSNGDIIHASWDETEIVAPNDVVYASMFGEKKQTDFGKPGKEEASKGLFLDPMKWKCFSGSEKVYSFYNTESVRRYRSNRRNYTEVWCSKVDIPNKKYLNYFIVFKDKPKMVSFHEGLTYAYGDHKVLESFHMGGEYQFVVPGSHLDKLYEKLQAGTPVSKPAK